MAKITEKKQSISKCPLKQTSIFTAFTKWNDSYNKMKMKKKSQQKFDPSLIIEIEDSDSDDNNESISPNSKIKLPIPMSSDEESEKDTQIQNKTGNKGRKLCAKRKLPFNNSSDEENSSDNLNSKENNRRNSAVTRNHLSNIKNRSELASSTHPNASSTPLKSSIPISPNTTYKIEELSTILVNPNDVTDNTSDSADSEKTIINEPILPQRSSFNILQNMIITPPCNISEIQNSSNNSTKRVADNVSVKETIEKELENTNKKAAVTTSCINTRHNRTAKRKSGSSEDEPSITKCFKQSPEKENLKHPVNNINHGKILAKGNTSKRGSLNEARGHKQISNQAQATGSDNEQTNASNSGDAKTTETEKQIEQSGKNMQNKDKNTNTTDCEKGALDSESNKQTRCSKSLAGTKVDTKKGERTIDTTEEQTSSNDNSKEQQTNTSKSQDAKITENEKGIEQSRKNIQEKGKKNNTEDLLKSPKGKGAINRSNNQASTSKSLENTTATIKAKKEERKMNMQWLKLITDLFTSVFKSKYRKNFSDSQKASLKLFFSMDNKYQYLCLKLFCWQRKWYNIFKFCNLISLDMEDMDICEMYNFLKENKIIATNYAVESLINLLQRVDVKDIKSICETFKLKQLKNNCTKQAMIESLMKVCKTQSTLCLKSTEELIKEEISKKMGKCIMLDEDFHNTLYMTYVLGTLSNSLFSNIEDYVKNMLLLKVVFPLEENGKNSFEDYCVFYSNNEVSSYVQARRYYLELVKVGEKQKFNHVEYLQICQNIFKELKAIKDIPNENDERYKAAPHMIRFTAAAVYVKALSNAVTVVRTKFPKDVKTWLEYMIKNINFSCRIGEWYYHLSWLYMKYLEPFDYEHAAKLIIEVLKEKSQYFSEVQLHKLGKRGQLLKVTKKYKIDQLYHDTIAEYSPTVIDIKQFPSHEVDAKTIRGNVLGQKRNYVIDDDSGNKQFVSVEYIALQYYLTKCGYTEGRHCEGRIILALFTLFFWDIIYDLKTNIPGTFISDIQTMPLDMNTKYFYLNRKDAIEKRLKEIESEWTDIEVVKWLQDNYTKHSHKTALCEVGTIIENPILLEMLVNCIGRRVLAKIYERYAQNVRVYRSGIPDLLVWNVDRKTSKFVEVKGENDTLSMGQKLWLKYLQSIGADIEVCHVHSIGSKRKKRDGLKKM